MTSVHIFENIFKSHYYSHDLTNHFIYSKIWIYQFKIGKKEKLIKGKRFILKEFISAFGIKIRNTNMQMLELRK